MSEASLRGRPRLVAACALLAVLLLCVGAGFLLARLQPGGTHALLLRFVRFEDAHPAASWVFAFAVELGACLLGVLPASIPAVAAGLLYGIVPGFLLAAVAVLLGAALAFAASRSLLRPFVLRFLARSPRARALDAAVMREGWRLVCLLRISPVMPFALTSYALGVTSLRMTTYLAGTLLSLPPLLGYVALGRLARHGLATFLLDPPVAGPGRVLDLGLLGVGVVGTVLLLLLFGRLARLAVAGGGRELQF